MGALILQREGFGFFLELQDRLYGGAGRHSLGGLAKLIGPEKISWTDEEAVARGPDAVERFDKSGRASGLAEPLHPDVQEAYLKLIRASAEKFASYSSFKGITIIAGNMFYKSDEDGYGDFPVMEFERETGLKIPVEANAGARFAKRYEWLMGNARERWISWRAGKLADFYRRLSDELQTLAPGRKLQLMASSAWKPFASWPDFDLKDYWFKRGIDQEALRSIPYFSIMPVIEPYIERVGLDFGRGANIFRNERLYGFSKELPALFDNCLISYHSNFEVYGAGFADERIKIPGFVQSTKTQHSFSTPLPDNQFVLEHLARTAADFNLENLYHGWWGSPDNGALKEHLPFYRAYRAIPVGAFEKVPGVSDPVQAKILAKEKESFLLLVNREFYPVKLELSLKPPVKALLDVVEGSSCECPAGRLSLEMKPFQIRCFKSVEPLAVASAAQVAPAAIVKDLKSRLEDLKRALPSASGVAGAKKVAELAAKAFEDKEWSYLKHLLESGPACEALHPKSPNKAGK